MVQVKIVVVLWGLGQNSCSSLKFTQQNCITTTEIPTEGMMGNIEPSHKQVATTEQNDHTKVR